MRERCGVPWMSSQVNAAFSSHRISWFSMENINRRCFSLAVHRRLSSGGGGPYCTARGEPTALSANRAGKHLKERFRGSVC